MRKVYPIGLALFLTLLPQIGRSCSCIAAETFCEKISPQSDDPVLRGMILELYTLSSEILGSVPVMDVVILEQYYGTATADTITLIGQDGLNCAASISDEFFSVGTEIVFLAWNQATSGQTEHFQSAHYPAKELAGCGPSHLIVTDGVVQGPIAPGESAKSLTDFTAEFPQCRDFVNATTDVIQPSTIQVLPNPSSGFIQIDFPTAQIVALQLIDLTGRKVWSTTLDFRAERRSQPVDLTGLPAGVYFLQFQPEGERPTTQRIVIQ